MKKLLLTILAGLSLNLAIAQTPTVSASNVVITSRTATSLTVTWTSGNGGYALVVCKPALNSTSTPVSACNQNYVSSTNYGSGANLGNSNYVVAETTGNSVTINNLASSTQYRVYVYEYNIINNGCVIGFTLYDNYFYKITSVPSDVDYTLATEPTTNVTNLSASSISYTSATINWTSSNGANDLISVRDYVNPFVSPVDGIGNSANVNFGSGTNMGSGNYVCYIGGGTSFNLSNLLPANIYYVRGFGFNGSSTGNTYNYMIGGYASYTLYTLNNPPTLNAISNYTVCQDASLQTVSLSGIGDGSSLENQNITFSATSSNTTLIPNGNISFAYSNPNTTGSLYYIPAAGQFGTSVITVTANDGWSSTNTIVRTFTVTVSAKPFAAGVITGNSTVCSGTSQIYSIPAVSYATSYTWNFPTSFTVTAGGTTNNVTVTVPNTSAATAYTFSVTPNNSCGVGAKASKTITVDPHPTTPNAGPNQSTVCDQNATAFLTANAVNAPNVGTWTWISGTPTPGIGNASSASTSVTGLTSPKTFVFQWAVTNTLSICPTKTSTVSISTDFLNVLCTPASNFSYGVAADVGPTYVCVGSTVNFTNLSISANSYQWDFTYNGTSPVFTSTLLNPSHVYGAVGTYTVYLRIFSNATGLFYNSQQVINVIDKPATPGLIFGTTSGICAGSSNNYVYSISAMPNATSYNWTLPTGGSIVANPSATSIAVMYGSNAQPGPITISAQNSCGTSTTSTLSINLTPLPSLAGSVSGLTTVCQGTMQTYTVVGITNATAYGWTDLDGVYTQTAGTSTTFNISSSTISGRIYVTGINSCGRGDSISLNVTVDPLPAAAGGVNGLTQLSICPVQTSVSYSVAPIGNATLYNWSITNGGVITAGAGTNMITVDYTGVTTTGSVTVTGNNACGNGPASLPAVVNFDPLPVVDICTVTVDSASTHNEIFWEKGGAAGIEKYRVYRKISVTTDTLVGEVLYGADAYLLDTLGIDDPNASPLDYTILAVDSCGNVGPKGPYHRTMFLQIGFGPGVMNLSWNDYIGQTANFYRVYRDSTNLGNWELLSGAVLPIGNNVYTDNNPPVNTFDLVYLIDADWLTTCDPSRGVINTTRSNIKSARTTGINQVLDSKSLNIYPNPSTDVVNIEMVAGMNPVIEIMNTLGEVVYTIKTSETKLTLDVSQWSRGVYVVNMTHNGNRLIKKLVIQ